MKNAFSLILAGGILAASAMFAAPLSEVTVNVPHEVTVGSTVLPAGAYTMLPYETSNGAEFFIVRSNNTSLVVPVQKVEGDSATKTAVTFSEDGGAWHLNRLSVEGETTSYEFSGR
jgi:hypothetical protein